MTKRCKDCGSIKESNEFYGLQGECKECTKARIKVSSRNIKRNCLICAKEFGTCKSEIRRGGGKTCSRECFYEYLRKTVKRGSESHAWKGDKAGYGSMHDWVRKELGKPSFCEICKTLEAKKYEWANISGQYKRDVTDWKRLCTRCHHKFDNHGAKWRETVKKGTNGMFSKLK